jgi:glycosyltransferase involved in cell wall biosynthesis
MRILLLAYAFPPLATPQALRWHYFSRELVARGHDVHVLAPDLVVDEAESIEVPRGVTVHRCSPGGLTAQIHQHRRRKQDARVLEPAPAAVTAPASAAENGAQLNWKGRLHRNIDSSLSYFMYPDSTSQWLSPARAQLQRLLPYLRPDVLIGSHEPAGVLQLALDVRGDTPWIADLGDPVLASYTPARWRRKAQALEARVCREADHVIVTTEATRSCLVHRHAASAQRIAVVPQGFDACGPTRRTNAGAGTEPDLNLFYGGRFYPFRDPGALIEAVLSVPGVRLHVATPELSPAIRRMGQANPEKIELLGRLTHAATRSLQQAHDVLVNIGNRSPEQTPGKLFEYFGACRPILHLSSSERDPAEDLLLRHSRGWSCPNEPAAIAAVLRQLVQRKRVGRLDDGLDLGLETVAAYQWRTLGGEIERLLQHAAGHADPRRQTSSA